MVNHDLCFNRGLNFEVFSLKILFFWPSRSCSLPSCRNLSWFITKFYRVEVWIHIIGIGGLKVMKGSKVLRVNGEGNFDTARFGNSVTNVLMHKRYEYCWVFWDWVFEIFQLVGRHKVRVRHEELLFAKRNKHDCLFYEEHYVILQKISETIYTVHLSSLKIEIFV